MSHPNPVVQVVAAGLKALRVHPRSAVPLLVEVIKAVEDHQQTIPVYQALSPQQRYYQKNREKRRAYQRAYQAANREKLNEYQREFKRRQRAAARAAA